MAEPRYRAFLLDFRGILVHDPPGEWWVSTAMERMGRSAGPDEIAALGGGHRLVESCRSR